MVVRVGNVDIRLVKMIDLVVMVDMVDMVVRVDLGPWGT